MIMLKALFLPCFIFFISSSFGKEGPRYPVKEIPEDLKRGMYAVIRESDVTFEIYSKSKSSFRYKMVISILNAKAKEYASVAVGYDKFRKVESLKANVYDADGNLIRKLKANEINDQSAISGFSLFEDNRVKFADLSYGIYPYTVEVEYEIQKKYLYAIPEFNLYEDDEIAIQKTRYSIIYPLDLKPLYKLNNINEPKKITQPDGKESLEWYFENIRPNKFESYSPDSKRIIPNVIASPRDFEYGGYAGKMDTWENLGKWQILLNEGRDLLPEQTKQKVKQLTAGVSTVEDKVRILYEYLQNRTRYVSIQKGIGGCQPFEASVVDQLGYGDCKALSNYMVALLKEVDIKGYYTQIYAGKENQEVTPDFAMDYFNHIIVSVPNGTDTLWLECTDQTAPFGFLGSFTSDRYALMITESGGKLVRTPTYTAEQNIQSRSADVYLNSLGDASAKVKTSYSGIQYEAGGLNFYVNLQHDDQKKWIQKNTDIPSFDINSFSMTNRKDKVPTAVVSVEYQLNRLATISGKRIFLNPNLMNRSTYIPEKLEARKTPIVLKTAYTDLDSIHYHLPEGIYPEVLPAPVKIKTRFGEYEAQYKVDQGTLLYTRKIKMIKGEFPAATYNELVDFYRNVNKADNTKLVFMSKT